MKIAFDTNGFYLNRVVVNRINTLFHDTGVIPRIGETIYAGTDHRDLWVKVTDVYYSTDAIVIVVDKIRNTK